MQSSSIIKISNSMRMINRKQLTKEIGKKKLADSKFKEQFHIAIFAHEELIAARC